MTDGLGKRAARSRRADTVIRDPYGQEVQFNDRHVSREDFTGKRIEKVERDRPAAIESRYRQGLVDAIVARYGLPGLVAVVILLRLLGIDVV